MDRRRAADAVGLGTRPGDVIVVSRDAGHFVRRLIHGSVSGYCSQHARRRLLVVPS